MEPAMEAGVETASGPKSLGAVVQIDDNKIRAHLEEVVRSTMEETLNALLDADTLRRIASAVNPRLSNHEIV